MDLNEKGPDDLIFNSSNTTFKVHIAKNKNEIESAIEFRQKNFLLKSNSNQPQYISTSTDEFDAYYSHLLVTELENNSIVGYCRIMKFEDKNPSLKYYTETIFDLNKIKSQKLRFLEIGRLCINENYKRQNIIGKIWSFFYSYCDYYDLDYLSGTLTPGFSADLSSKIYAYAKTKDKIQDPSLFVEPLEINKDTTFKSDYHINNFRELRLELPSLFLTYLTLGARIASIGAYCKDLNSICFYMLCDISDRKNNTKHLRFKH